jgi:hypothetical protein
MSERAYIRVKMTLGETFPIWQNVAAIWAGDILRVTTLRDCPTVGENGLVWMQQYFGGEDIWISPATPCLVSLRQYEDVALKQLSLFAS